MLCQKIALIGVGLLGGSLGLAIRERRLAARVEGYVRRAASLEECERFGAVDQATLDLATAVTGSDLVVLCTPIAQMRGLAERMVPALAPGAVVTDVGSVKGAVVETLEPLVAAAGGHFIGSHPMAGAEQMGVRHARADLFEGAVCAVTPTKQSSPEALRRIKELWRALGARTVRLSPDLHDELVSRSSHLPHVVAAELANYVLSPAHSKEQAVLCANGFRDTTRIASGSPEMWRDIALANRRHLTRVLGVFIEDLQELRLALEKGQEQVVAEFFEKAKQRRDAWCAQSNSPE
jgi:prephenate dehydrogenase